MINNPSVDPHDYEPTSKIAKEVANSNVLVANGVGYDGWMSKLAKNAPKATYIKVGEDLLDKKDGDNPHLWYNPKTMPKLANDLANISVNYSLKTKLTLKPMPSNILSL